MASGERTNLPTSFALLDALAQMVEGFFSINPLAAIQAGNSLEELIFKLID